MYIKYDVDLENFEFWSGAKYTADVIKRNSDMGEIQRIIEDDFSYDDRVPTETEINDLFWFEEDWLAQCLGYADWEDYEENR